MCSLSKHLKDTYVYAMELIYFILPPWSIHTHIDLQPLEVIIVEL